ncbi:hypothetical protein Y1Q_0019293 [Alligator mississippiensis]|uniref:Uncharacterized protein n=1 Tax=Alligator mississippiensis TaxID=8496 RepID=A0A151MQV1_ALLMI|nr:hypothetical protein Y1Q_0019293 [Alligator mississippiensis]
MPPGACIVYDQKSHTHTELIIAFLQSTGLIGIRADLKICTSFCSDPSNEAITGQKKERFHFSIIQTHAF